MRLLTPALLMASLLLLGCPNKKNNGETPTVEPTTALAAATDTPAEPVETTPATVTYHLFDNGVRCVTFPCPSWSAIDPDSKETKITNVDLSALGLTKDKAQELQAKLMAGHVVTGTIVAGPKGPAGEGTTLAIESVGEAKPKPMK